MLEVLATLFQTPLMASSKTELAKGLNPWPPSNFRDKDAAAGDLKEAKFDMRADRFGVFCINICKFMAARRRWRSLKKFAFTHR
jgi:hypothetical protein